jgi:hypothetical protein
MPVINWNKSRQMLLSISQEIRQVAGNLWFEFAIKLNNLNRPEDSRNRKIIAMGYWPFPDRQDDVDQEASSSHPIIWLHFRSSTISLFLLRLRPSDGHSSGLSPLRELSTGHYGFCQAIADPLHGRMFIPDHEVGPPCFIYFIPSLLPRTKPAFFEFILGMEANRLFDWMKHF